MAARTSASKVRQVLELDPDDPAELTTAIDSANTLVNTFCTNSGYTNANLELIERWLAAHFWTITDGGMVTEEQVASIRQKTAFKVDLFLTTTHFGQQALALDTACNLARFNNRLKESKLTPGVIWYGKRSSNWGEGSCDG